jgi:hypothetical protein
MSTKDRTLKRTEFVVKMRRIMIEAELRKSWKLSKAKRAKEAQRSVFQTAIPVNPFPSDSLQRL